MSGPAASAPKRIQLKRAKGWRLPEGAVGIGRPGRWGNPFDFRRSEYCWAALSFGCRGDAAGRREASVRAFREWIDPGYDRRTLEYRQQPRMGSGDRSLALGPEIMAGAAPSIREVQAALRGRDLACWCGLDQACHGDVLLEIANGPLVCEAVA